MNIYKQKYSPMQLKSISKILNAKFEAYLNSIENTAVREIVKENTIITGGCIASMLTGEPINDFDLYFRTREAALAVAQYYIDLFIDAKGWKKEDVMISTLPEDADRVRVVIESGEGRAEQCLEPEPGESAQEEADKKEDDEEEVKIPRKPYRPVYISSNAITLSNKVQLIVRFFGEPEDIHSNYDFIHCTNYWTSWDNKVITSEKALLSLMSKTLYYSGSLYPICSIIRLRKFISRGWTITAGQILKMCWQVSLLDLTDPKVLEDQLIGVDSLYFAALIDALKKQDKIEGHYLYQLIDEIFDPS